MEASRTSGAARAVVLLSGGLDSATVLAIARSRGFECYALSVDYGQRHRAELDAAVRVAGMLGATRHVIAEVDLSRFGGSALTDASIPVPEADAPAPSGPTASIPVTYVPARNTIMLSIALGWAEVLGADDIFFGANAVDYSGYPDCRPEYVEAFERMANLATKSAVEGRALHVHAPIIRLSKAEIIRQGALLGVDFSQTVSCYQADHAGRACGRCDSCRIRREGFAAAGLPDPTRYQPG
ncbi:7-cyano-7-deazaguanine synthase QueC [Burkholderiaceae bacterium FT117]|uniref:7-cyano-7-deazaguanine synthase QueC n=1 Tax=Zeimonas sediminis TaxID=2944268 RepID=UPI0023431941|nr:7-cyano-7-deazaguanine synthase QueC [Zeimonas sediminis]MCM5570317.1 7-cyano-7-deazaguanine synthase QueC [Zeimonas sediminis]